MPLWFKIAGLIVFLALIGTAVGIVFAESWADVIDDQLKTLRANDIAKAYTDYTSKEFQKATSLEQFKEFIDTHPFFIHNQSVFFPKRINKENMRIMRGYLVSDDHTQIHIQYRLVKEGDSWKIQQIKLLKQKVADQR